MHNANAQSSLTIREYAEIMKKFTRPFLLDYFTPCRCTFIKNERYRTFTYHGNTFNSLAVLADQMTKVGPCKRFRSIFFSLQHPLTTSSTLIYYPKHSLDDLHHSELPKCHFIKNKWPGHYTRINGTSNPTLSICSRKWNSRRKMPVN